MMMVQLQFESEAQTKRAKGVNSSPRASGLETQEEPMVQFQPKGRKRLMSRLNSQAGGVPSYSRVGQPFSSIQVFTLLNKAHPHWGGPLLYSVHPFKC